MNNKVPPVEFKIKNGDNYIIREGSTSDAKKILIKITLTAIIFLGLTGCSTMKQKNELNIYNYKDDFKKFWNESKGVNYDKKFKVWDKYLENKYQDLYLSVFWAKKNTPEKWDKIRKEKMKDSFDKIKKNYDRIINNFENFDSVLNEQINKYKLQFPDADFTKISIYAVPSLGAFNGKGTSLNSAPEKTILVFGIDMLTWRDDNPDILYSHELFHIYHIEKMDINEKIATEIAQMTLPLWLEGFATLISGKFNKNASLGDLLMDSELGKIKNSNIALIASSFLKISNRKPFSKDDPMIYKRWFATGYGSAINGLPERLGYYLGYFVTKEIEKKHSVADMVNWKIERIHKEVIETLHILSKRK